MEVAINKVGENKRTVATKKEKEGKRAMKKGNERVEDSDEERNN